jgi:hypothetical protein
VRGKTKKLGNWEIKKLENGETKKLGNQRVKSCRRRVK